VSTVLPAFDIPLDRSDTAERLEHLVDRLVLGIEVAAASLLMRS
jgi:hypothetical protein